MKMTRSLQTKIQVAFGAIASTAAALLFALPTYAVTSSELVQRGVDIATDGDPGLQLFGANSIAASVTTTLLYAVGILSVIMIIVGGLRYVISGGNATAVTAAKNTILYAIVGLVVAILAYAIIHFVLGVFVGGGTDGFTDV